MFTTVFFALLLTSLCLSTAVDSQQISNDFNVHEKIVLNSVKTQELEKRLSDMELSHKADRATLLNEISLAALANTELSRELRDLKEQVLNDIEILTSHQDTLEVAFSAYNPSSMNYGNGHTVVYQSTLMNTGSGYDNNTGIFTAPTSGLYLFTVHTCSAANQYAIVAIVHENTRLATDTQYASASSCGSVSALHHVTQGETVHIASAYGITKMQTDQYRRNSFLGVLLHVDRLDTSSQQLGPIA